MAFDINKFLQTSFKHRTEAVPVPDMKEFFAEGSRPEWVVRSLTGQEIGRCAEAATKRESVNMLISGLMSTVTKETVEAAKDLIGIGTDTPADIAKRIEHLVVGSVDPVCSLELAVRVCEVYPVEFYQITNKIMELSGKGQVPGKSTPSGRTQKSAQALPSDMPGGDSSTN